MLNSDYFKLNKYSSLKGLKLNYETNYVEDIHVLHKQLNQTIVYLTDRISLTEKIEQKHVLSRLSATMKCELTLSQTEHEHRSSVFAKNSLVRNLQTKVTTPLVDFENMA